MYVCAVCMYEVLWSVWCVGVSEVRVSICGLRLVRPYVCVLRVYVRCGIWFCSVCG